MVLNLIALYLRQIQNKEKNEFILDHINRLQNIPEKINEILENKKQIQKLADKYSEYHNFLFLGRGINYPVALEGALKLKEVSYIHAEGYSSGELKHGPLAMIDENFPTIVITPQEDPLYDKIISNIKEIKARKGPVIAIANEGDEDISELVEDVIYVPKTNYYLSPLSFVLPLQLFAYYVAIKLGRNVDQPRNLAKSVTVE